MCLYSLTDMTLCWAFIQYFCVAVMHQDCGEWIDCIPFVITSWNVQMEQFSFCLHTHVVCVMPKPQFTWHLGSKPMISMYRLTPKRQAHHWQKAVSVLMPNRKAHRWQKDFVRIPTRQAHCWQKVFVLFPTHPVRDPKCSSRRKQFVLDLVH